MFDLSYLFNFLAGTLLILASAIVILLIGGLITSLFVAVLDMFIDDHSKDD